MAIGSKGNVGRNNVLPAACAEHLGLRLVMFALRSTTTLGARFSSNQYAGQSVHINNNGHPASGVLCARTKGSERVF